MLTREDGIEVHALAKRGRTISAIARHRGRDRKTIRLSERPGAGVRKNTSTHPFEAYCAQRLNSGRRRSGSITCTTGVRTIATASETSSRSTASPNQPAGQHDSPTSHGRGTTLTLADADWDAPYLACG